MTPEAVFAAYTLLSWVPHEQVLSMRRALDEARRRASLTSPNGGGTATTTRLAWSDEDAALAWLVDITRDCWCLWPTERRIH
jgi:hypothetical protein